MKKPSVLLFLLWWVMIAVECGRNSEECHYSIEARNVSSANYFVIGTTWTLHNHVQTASPYLSPEAHLVEAGKTSNSPLSSRSCWEGVLESRNLYVYSFHDSLAGYEWETIVSQQLFDGPDVYTLNDLRANGFKVTVP